MDFSFVDCRLCKPRRDTHKRNIKSLVSYHVCFCMCQEFNANTTSNTGQNDMSRPRHSLDQ